MGIDPCSSNVLLTDFNERDFLIGGRVALFIIYFEERDAGIDFTDLPTTMYDDYAINETLFHWQSQNSAGPDTSKGKSYIKHKETEKKILLFVREKNKDEFGNTMGYVFVGEGQLIEHYGTKPMNIKWKLNEALPNYLWKDAAKLRVG